MYLFVAIDTEYTHDFLPKHQDKKDVAAIQTFVP